MTRLFVYGTLRRGERNHPLLGTSPLLARTQTHPHFTLCHLGAYPALLTGGHTAVLGEVYAVDPPTLLALDALEEHPDYYQRTPIPLADGTTAETYLLPARFAQSAPPIPSGDWCPP